MISENLQLSSTTVCYPLSVSPHFTLERALEGIAAAGLDWVEVVAIPGYCPHIEPETMDAREIADLQRLVQKYHIRISTINVATDLTTTAGVARLDETLRVARHLGIDTVVTHVEQTETKEGEARFRDLLPRIVSRAEAHDVVIALETHGGLVTTGQQGIRLLQEVGSDHLKLTYDTANVVYHAGILPEDDLSALGSDIGKYIAHVHLKDKASMKLREYDFPPFGEGVLNLPLVLQMLEEGGYRGHVCLEVELDGQPSSPEVVDEALMASYQYLQNLPGGLS